MPTAATFEEFLRSLTRLGGVVSVSPDERTSILEAAEAIQGLGDVSRESLTALIEERSERARALGLCAGLSQEQLKNWLRLRFGSSSWRRVARSTATELVAAMDDEFDLVQTVAVQRARAWTFGDVLVERYGSRSRAAGSVARGRSAENEVESVVNALGLPHQMRGRFIGRRGETEACDLAIPAAGEAAKIVCAIKGFDSTGSKLSDAMQEITRMAEVRRPDQFVFAVVDGSGWISRQADLRRIFSLAEQKAIDGLYTLSQLAGFREDLERAARRLDLTST